MLNHMEQIYCLILSIIYQYKGPEKKKQPLQTSYHHKVDQEGKKRLDAQRYHNQYQGWSTIPHH